MKVRASKLQQSRSRCDGVLGPVRPYQNSTDSKVSELLMTNCYDTVDTQMHSLHLPLVSIYSCTGRTYFSIQLAY